MDGVITDIDPSVSQHGYEPRDLIGTPASPDYIDSHDFDAFVAKLRKSGVVCDCTVQVKTKDGALMDAALDARLVFGNDGRAVAVDGVLRESAKNRDEFARRGRDEVTRKLVMVLTHEIHNPLTGILGNLSLFRTEDTSEAGRQRLQEIEKYAQEIKSYLAELKDLNLPQPAATTTTDLVKIVHEIEKKHLEYSLKVITDQLTEVYNRRFFDQFLEREVNRSKRYGYTATILSITIDNFKEIRAGLGRAFANKALVETANLLKSCVRNSDILARDGECSFLILLPETDGEKSRYVLRRIEEKCVRRNQSKEQPVLHLQVKSSSCI